VTYQTEDSIHEVTHVGMFKHGLVNGPVWSFLQGGNYLFGNLKDSLKLENFTTDHGAYLSQDLISGYFGQFFEDKMVSGQEVNITDHAQVDQIVTPIFTKPSGYVFKHFTTSSSGGRSEGSELDDPLLPDPLEQRYVYVNSSSIEGNIPTS
jgi:hypothetical protein